MGSESSNPPHLVSVCSYCITVVSDIHDTVARLHTSYTLPAPHLTSWHRAMTIPRHGPMHNLQFSAPLDHDLWSDSKLLIVRTASLICIWNLLRSGLRNRLIGSQLMVEWILNPYFSQCLLTQVVFDITKFPPTQVSKTDIIIIVSGGLHWKKNVRSVGEQREVTIKHNG